MPRPAQVLGLVGTNGALLSLSPLCCWEKHCRCLAAGACLMEVRYMCAGIGKSTALKVLAGKLKPNLGRFEARGLVSSAVLQALCLHELHARHATLSPKIVCGPSDQACLPKGSAADAAGAPQSPPDWQEILTHFRGSELQNYFTRILEDDLHAIIKPQYVDHIPKAVRCAPACSGLAPGCVGVTRDV